MKVTMTAESKRFITLEEAPIARGIIADMKEDESTAAEYATYAVNAACNSGGVEIYKATATIAKNCRIYNAFAENSRDLDIWIDATAQTYEGFCVIGAYLSDIWKISGDNAVQLATEHMNVRKFSEVKC